MLSQGIVLYLNEIAEIVHGRVVEHSGSIIKNTGDAFLLLWKFNEEDLETNKIGEIVRVKDNS